MLDVERAQFLSEKNQLRCFNDEKEEKNEKLRGVNEELRALIDVKNVNDIKIKNTFLAVFCLSFTIKVNEAALRKEIMDLQNEVQDQL